MLRCAVTAALAAALALPALAQIARPFPATALRGDLVVVQPPDVLLNGRAARLAPGARIRGTDNLVKLSATLVDLKLAVNYTLDPLGLVHDVWILTAAERAKEPWPRTPEQAARWSFDAAAQAWTKP